MRLSFVFPKAGYPIGLASVSFKGDLLLKVTTYAGVVPEEKDTPSFFEWIEDESDILLLKNRTDGEEVCHL
jgi:hypothetical protein